MPAIAFGAVRCNPGSCLSADRTYCDDCSAGHYSSSLNQTACTACPPGTYSALDRLAGPINPGVSYPTAMFYPLDCGGGSYYFGFVWNGMPVYKCPVNSNYVWWQQGSGWYATGASTPVVPYAGADRQGAMDAIVAAYYNPAGRWFTRYCEQCPPGSYSDTPASPECTACGAGLYAAGAGSTACGAAGSTTTTTTATVATTTTTAAVATTTTVAVATTTTVAPTPTTTTTAAVATTTTVAPLPSPTSSTLIFASSSSSTPAPTTTSRAVATTTTVAPLTTTAAAYPYTVRFQATSVQAAAYFTAGVVAQYRGVVAGLVRVGADRVGMSVAASGRRLLSGLTTATFVIGATDLDRVAVVDRIVQPDLTAAIQAASPPLAALTLVGGSTVVLDGSGAPAATTTAAAAIVVPRPGFEGVSLAPPPGPPWLGLVAGVALWLLLSRPR